MNNQIKTLIGFGATTGSINFVMLMLFPSWPIVFGYLFTLAAIVTGYYLLSRNRKLDDQAVEAVQIQIVIVNQNILAVAEELEKVKTELSNFKLGQRR